MPTNYRFGGGVADTVLNPIVLVAMLAALAVILFLPRKWVLPCFLLMVFLTPSGQTLVVGGVHLYVVRIVILAGLIRLVSAKFTGGAVLFSQGFNGIDAVFLCWALTRALACMLLYASPEAIANQCGFLWDSLGGYFVLRLAIQNREDVLRAAKVLAPIAVIIALGMANEQISKTNIFGYLGGALTPDVREGKLRSQGPFAHAITAGLFGATIVPLFVALWSAQRPRIWAASGIAAATIIVVASASSTPFGAYVAGIGALCLWHLRRNMRALRWALAIGLCCIAMVMKAPIWFLLAHVDLVGGSSGYHRAMLVDTCIRHFSDWWLFGTHDNQTWGWDMWDIQNQFVAEAFRGGLAAFALFLLLIVRAFGRIGKKVTSPEADRKDIWLAWTVGALLLAHVVAFFGADYFDQLRFWWYTSLVFVSAIGVPAVTSTDLPHFDNAMVEPVEHPQFACL